MGLVVVQRGHCFRTSGATGAPGEQEFTKAAADRAAFHLRTVGHQVRIINADVPDADYRGDLFVAIHYDSAENPAARGASVGYQTPEGNQFAWAWKRRYVELGWPTGVFKPDNYTAKLHNYYGVRNAVEQGNRRAFIAEAGFHSNPADAALLAAPEGPDRVGRSIALAVVDMIGDPTPAPTPDPIIEETPDMFLYSGPKTPVFFCHDGQSVGLNESTDMPTFIDQDVKHFKLDGDTYLKFRDRFPGD